MRSTFLLALAGACDSSRAPIGLETQMAPTAADLAEVAIKRHPVDPGHEQWSVSHASDGWVLQYLYDHEALSIEWQATYARRDDDTFVPTNMFGRGLKPNVNSARKPMSPVPWGEDGECSAVAVSDLDIGFECHGREGRRGFAVKVYGVSPHGPGAPSVVLAGPLRALEQWDPAARE